MAKFHNVAQGTPAWRELRRGIPTASNFHRLVTPKKGEPSKQADGYLYDLAAEMILGRPLEGVQTSWIKRGTELEPKAIEYFEFVRDVETTPVGFVTNDAGTAGASPDRLIGDRGILEAKCPSEGVQVQYILFPQAGVDHEYRCQLQGQLYICEREYAEIIAWHPDLPHAIVKVERDEEFIKLLDAALKKFTERLALIKEDLNQRGWLYKAPAEHDHSHDFITDEDLREILAARGETL